MSVFHIKVKLADEHSKAPDRANVDDAGADLFATETRVLQNGESYLFDTGVAIQLDGGTTGLVFSRSGLGSKGIRVRNGVGVIDAKYRGTIKVALENSSREPYEVKAGDRIAQLVIVPVITPQFRVVDELDMEGDRGGGLGHTGR